MKKILIIDDADFILDSTATLLKYEGYEVFAAPNGHIGIKTAFENKPDMIICDIAMPGIDGFKVLEEIRKNPETEATPFIFLTAFSEKAKMRAGMERGADDFIVKPYTHDELILAIEAQWAKRSRLEKKLNEKIEEVGRSVTCVLPHEFRTVLNEVIGTAKYMNSDAENLTKQEIIEFSNDIISSSKRLLKITENFLLFVRIEAIASDPIQRQQLRKFRTDEPFSIFLDIASSKALQYDRNEDLVFGDNIEMVSLEISSESFYKIADEILDNAFKFSKKGDKIYISSFREGNMAVVEIKDKGRGMNPEQISKISALAQFERAFYEQQGAGMGLIIAKKLVELHDGIFKVDSSEGSGTTINFSLHCRDIE
ncbi:MAG: response regulator [Candidatus Kapabacteria bacterium]|nr:response regulator [Candidatus Kapabacteria bacterium]